MDKNMFFSNTAGSNGFSDNQNENEDTRLRSNSQNNYMQYLNFDDESNLSGSGLESNRNRASSLKKGDFLQQKMFEEFMMKQSQSNLGVPLNSLDFSLNNGSLLGMAESSHGNPVSNGSSQNFTPNQSVPNMSISNSFSNAANDQFQLGADLEMPLDMNFNSSIEQPIQRQKGLLDRLTPNTFGEPVNLQSPKSFPMMGIAENNMYTSQPREQQYFPIDQSVENQFENLPSLSSVSPNNENYWRNCISFVENVAFGKENEYSKADFIREQDKIKESTTLGDTDYADYIKVPEEGHMYNLFLGDLPTSSRVETQIKLQISIEPAPLQNIIHLSSNGIPRRKYMLKKPISSYKQNLLEHFLFLETHIIKASDKKKATVCYKCCKREERRFSRRKSGNTDADLWVVNDSKEALIFNTKQLMVLNQATIDLKSQKSSKTFVVPCRFVCYCRHHKETVGFKIVVLLKNAAGEILAKKTSQPLKIMNYSSKIKSIKDTASDVSDTASSVASESSYATDYSNSRQSSVDYSTSSCQSENDNLPLTTDQLRNPKVTNNLKTTTADLLQHQSPGNSSANLNAESLQRHQGQAFFKMQNGLSESQSPVTQFNSLLQPKSHKQQPIPIIYKIIPNSGPLSGGVEVTILGENFTPNTEVRFGVNKALAVNFWGPTTIVVTAPPVLFPGLVQVVALVNEMDVGRESPENMETIFTYIDQNDKELLELALQIVDLEVNGKTNESSGYLGNDPQSLAKKLLFEKQQKQQQQKPSDSNEKGQTLNLQPYKVVLSLLDTGNPIKNLNLKNSSGHTLLHLAVVKSHIELIIFLISNGANVNATDKFGYSPLHFACLRNDIRVMKMLVAMNCDKHSTTFTKALLTPLELFLNNYDSSTSDEYDQVYDLLKENKKAYSTSMLDNDSIYSNGSGYQAHISTMDKEQQTSVEKLVADSGEGSSDKDMFSPDWKHIAKESVASKTGTKASANGSTTSGMTMNTTYDISIDSHPPLYDDLFPDTVLKSPSEEFKDLNESQLGIDFKVPSLITKKPKSLLPAINPDNMKIDEIDTTDMEEKIISWGSYMNNETTDTEVFSGGLLPALGAGEQQKKGKLNSFNEDLVNHFKLMKEKQKDFLMDKKLLFFWIPFLFILVSTVVVLSFSSTDENSFADSWNLASSSARTKLANLFLGKQRWQGFVKNAIHQGEIKFKEAFKTESIHMLF